MIPRIASPEEYAPGTRNVTGTRRSRRLSGRAKSRGQMGLYKTPEVVQGLFKCGEDRQRGMVATPPWPPQHQAHFGHVLRIWPARRNAVRIGIRGFIWPLCQEQNSKKDTDSGSVMSPLRLKKWPPKNPSKSAHEVFNLSAEAALCTLSFAVPSLPTLPRLSSPRS
jgi:hypothetical protein